MGRESTVKPPADEETASEAIAARKQERALLQDIRDIERKISSRESDKATVKEKLDNLTDDIKGLRAQRDELVTELLDVVDGKAAPRLPFGPTAKKKEAVGPAALGLTKEAIVDAMYQLDAIAKEGASVAKAIVVRDIRHVVIPGPKKGDQEKGVYRLVPLHPPSYVVPGSHVKADYSGRQVDFMDAKLVMGSDDDTLLVDVNITAPTKSTAKAGNPGAATRGAAVDRGRKDVGDALDAALKRAGFDIDSMSDEELENHQMAVLKIAALVEQPANALEAADLALLTDWKQKIDDMPPSEVKIAVKKVASIEQQAGADAGGKKKRGRPKGSKSAKKGGRR